jgi:elongation factor Ts
MILEEDIVVEISASAVKELREKTGAGIMDCRKALEQAEGNVSRAVEVLRERGLARASKVAGRVANQGLVDTYIHAGGRIGAMIELNCETDFVARTDEFRALAHDLAMQVAATAPRYLTAAEAEGAGDTSGEETALLAQPFIKDSRKSIEDLVKEAIAKVGENIVVRRFVRFEVGAMDPGAPEATPDNAE